MKDSRREWSSLYVEKLNPDAKRFVVQCCLCGERGFKPSILEDGFVDSLVKKAIRRSLESHLDPLALDEFGRCSTCAAYQDKLISRAEAE